MSFPIKWDKPRVPTSKELENLRKAGYRITVLSNGDLLPIVKENMTKNMTLFTDLRLEN